MLWTPVAVAVVFVLSVRASDSSTPRSLLARSQKKLTKNLRLDWLGRIGHPTRLPAEIPRHAKAVLARAEAVLRASHQCHRASPLFFLPSHRRFFDP